jgi:hypothetical protein
MRFGIVQPDRPDANAEIVRDLFARANARMAWRGSLKGVAVALMIALIIAVVILSEFASDWPGEQRRAWALGWGLAALLVGTFVGRTSGRRDRAKVARMLEDRIVESRNLMLTSAELPREAVDAGLAALIHARAATVARAVDLREAVPLRRDATVAIAMALVFSAVTIVVSASSESLVLPLSAATTGPSVRGVDVTIVPPAYSGRPQQTARDPDRIEALAGSRLKFTIRAQADSVGFETLTGSHTARRKSAGEPFIAEIAADADGYVAIEPRSLGGTPGTRRVIGLTVTPDRLPVVRVTAPGRDKFLPDANLAIPVTVEAYDDIALTSLRLRYTKVSGSGENFKFTEGEFPLTLTRSSGTTWTGRGSIPLPTMALVPGDMIVYRGVSTDGRPGAPTSESDTYIVEIASPGSVASAGFASDDERDRYAVSQQMVILKTERLIKARATLHPDSVAAQAQLIAAEQRTVRAEFVFMMGGELAEEVVAAANMGDLNEAEHAHREDDLASGRTSVVRAIRMMSHADGSLNRVSLDTALVQEKEALAYLQSAFSRARYILRALTERERLDLSRRLTGQLSAVLRDAHPVALPAGEPRVAALRRVLADATSLAASMTRQSGRRSNPSTFGAPLARLAEALLAIDPGAADLQSVATTLSTASEAGVGRPVIDSTQAAITRLSAIVRRELATAPSTQASIDRDRLNAVVTRALRRGGRGMP